MPTKLLLDAAQHTALLLAATSRNLQIRYQNRFSLIHYFSQVVGAWERKADCKVATVISFFALSLQ